MPSPFKIMWRLFVAAFKNSGYFCVFIGQVFWYLWTKRPDKIGDAFGQLGTSTVDVLGKVFED